MTPKTPGTPGRWRTFRALVLNLPDPEVPSLSERLKGKTVERPQKAAQTAADEPQAASASSAWATAAQKATTPDSEPGDDGQLWTVKAKKPSNLQRIVRWALLILVLLFAWIGLRAATVGVNDEAEPPELPATATFPTEAAAGPAERFTEAYFTWDEDDKEARSEALSLWYTGGSAPEDLGWDGSGKQTADNATVISVDPSDDTHARVTVVADVTPYDSKDKAKETRPMALELSVQTDDNGTAVYGAPGIVGVPSPIQAQAPETTVAEDSSLARDTRGSTEDFFTSYGQEDDLSSVTAPGARIQGLDGALTEPKLTDWRVFDGSEDERTARAVVQWTTPSGAKSEQSYELTLVRVSGGESARWQIETLEGSES